MYSFCYRLLIFWLALNAVPWCASEQMERPNQPPSGIPPRVLRPLAKPSGYIFAGTVTAIKSLAPQGARGVAQIQITFHVDSAVRGVRTGQSLSIREWTGVWDAGQRYRVGEKVALFLYSPSKLGLTSVVGGALGRFPIQNGTVKIDPVRYPLRRTVRIPLDPDGPWLRKPMPMRLEDFMRAAGMAGSYGENLE